ncbi:MAG TPA: acetylglutamate kinase [bacterium]|nr:acetylglutamate kinase [bacterium]HPP11158.1 acetylglutamate kinase [bacterium]
MEEEILRKAEVLVEARPYIQRYQGSYFVVKLGGSIFRLPEARNSILSDIAFLHLVGIRCLVITGGGPFITEELQKSGWKPSFVDGLRVTDEKTLQVVRKVLGQVRDELCWYLRDKLLVPAAAIEPEERLLIARKIHYQKGAEVIDLGFVGQMEKVEANTLKVKAATSVVVLAPLAYGQDGALYNINGDSVAAAVAESLEAEKLVFLTNVLGVMRNPENPETLISILTVKQAETLIQQEVISGGMVPKVKAAVSSIRRGVKKVHIINGSLPHSLLLEIFTDQGVGTEIISDNGGNP